jgi:phage-related protein
MAGPLDRAFVEVRADTSKFAKDVQKGVDNAAKNIEKDLTDSVSRAESGMAREGAKLGRTVSDSLGSNIDVPDIDLNVDVDRRQVDNELDRAVRAARPPHIPIDIDIDREGGFARFASSITGIKLPVAGFAALGLAMASAAATAVQLAAALAPAVGIIAALPSGIGVLAAGISTLKVATLGVGDAFGSALTDDTAAFNEAIEGLAPNVQAAAQTIRDMKPALDELRNSVQQEFFAGFDDILNQLSETLLGPVTEGMTSVAAAVNGIITGLAGVATSSVGIDFVNQSFAITAQILESLQEPLTALFSALLSVGTALNEAFGESAGAGIANVVTQFAAFLSNAAASGEAVAWVQNALTVFQQIGDILSPIVGIFSSIGEAATATGGNILGVWGAALQTFDDFLSSAQGQSALIGVFEALNTVGDAFRDVLAGIAPALPPIISGIGNILGVVAPLLGPLSELVGSVLTALAPILTVVAAAIQPIIGPLTTVIELLSGVLVQAIEAVMPLIVTVGEVIGGVLGVAIEALLPILTVLIEALSPIIEALTPLFELLGVVAEIIGAVLAPIIQVLGDILMWLVDTIIVPILVPAIQAMADILNVVLTWAVNNLVETFKVAWDALGVLFGWLKDQFEQNIAAMQVIFEVLKAALQAGWRFIDNNFIRPTKAGFENLKNGISNILDGIKTAWNNTVNFFKGLPGKISNAVSGMWDGISSSFKAAINSIIGAWNGLSFSLPSVDAGPLGTFGGFTLSTPNIPYLARGGMATGPTLAMVGEGRHDEAILPLEDPRVTSMLASALGRAGVMAGNGGGDGAVSGTVSGGDMFPSFVVKIGERELTDIIIEQQNQANSDMLRRARTGTRRTR